MIDFRHMEQSLLDDHYGTEFWLDWLWLWRLVGGVGRSVVVAVSTVAGVAIKSLKLPMLLKLRLLA